MASVLRGTRKPGAGVAGYCCGLVSPRRWLCGGSLVSCSSGSSDLASTRKQVRDRACRNLIEGAPRRFHLHVGGAREHGAGDVPAHEDFVARARLRELRDQRVLASLSLVGRRILPGIRRGGSGSFPRRREQVPWSDSRAWQLPCQCSYFGTQHVVNRR